MEEGMSVKDAILNTQPTSYWPLDDLNGLSCHDEMGLHDASACAGAGSDARGHSFRGCAGLHISSTVRWEAS